MVNTGFPVVSITWLEVLIVIWFPFGSVVEPEPDRLAVGGRINLPAAVITFAFTLPFTRVIE